MRVSLSAQDTNSARNNVIRENLVGGVCAFDYDPKARIDYFSMKYTVPNIALYGDIDIFGNKFV